MAYLTAAIAALLATSVFLANKHGRHPFGESGAKAVGWWVALVALDVIVAEMVVVGAFEISIPDAVDDWGGALRGAAVGILGPLSLRSPVRITPIRGRPERVGFTYVYDRARISLDDALDEQITRLRRDDRRKVESKIDRQGWTAAAVLELMNQHVSDVRRLQAAPAEAQRIRAAMREIPTLPEEARIQGLIKIALDERFTALIDELKSRGPSTEEERCGQALIDRWATDDLEEDKPTR